MTKFVVKPGVKNLQHEDEKLVTTHCCYCGMQCGMHIRVNKKSGNVVGVEPRYDWPVTNGKMCPKGVTAYQTVDHPDRIKTPLIKKNGKFVESTWEEALDLIEKNYKRLQSHYGKDALSVFGGVSMTNEKCYLVGKYARVALGTRYVDYNGRFCMSSAAGGFMKTLGLDRGSTLPWPELEHTDCFFMAGTNTAECHPTTIQWLWKARDKGAKMIVADPRETPTARIADVHLDLKAGTDSALANGMMHLLIKEGYVDEAYVQTRCHNFEELKEAVKAFTPEKTAMITGIDKEKIVKAATIFGRSPRSVVMFARGIEQQRKGVDNVCLYTSMALLRGQIGKFASGVATFTGQGNGQGGREHGQKADALPGYRKIDNPEHVAYVSDVWGIDPKEMPQAGVSAYEMFDHIQQGKIKAMHVICSNPAVSAPNNHYIWEGFKRLDFMVVSDFFLSETAEFADVVLPTTTWAEDEGTTTNLEGRVIRIRKVKEPVGEAKTDWEIMQLIAERMGKKSFFPYTSVSDIYEEFRLASKGGKADYYGITYDRIEKEDGVFWPCPDEKHPGSPTMFTESFATEDGKANLAVVGWEEPGETPSEDYPHILTTGRVVFHYLSGTQTRRTPFLMEQCPEPYAEIHPEMAAKYRLNNGDRVVLTTKRGDITVPVKLTKAIRRDHIFVPYHWGKELSINKLTNPALDPTSRMPEFKVCAVRMQKA
ncbi:formate dehydrogenase subunit alpha [Salipaludibacillus agaradhaerens]|uniref:formate dehydrogenase subunit alpha n=1 Tax=Salipaludibacillus agaradhaerens TaxID=76935 RepID=UPI002150BAF8|nr:formate dehydrogenase subunit alpha [Salipaludibacillus agaradhaerens]MCR6107354.1 formate dehydrogenase subunit alpha [Salipaludibacillus agaradhaerens]MCR6119383.1 formate dehydrogenase subunit alpha [Salipaludibacillus agaradhaerens]